MTALPMLILPSNEGTTEAGCLAHARRKFHELWINHQSPIGEQALPLFAKLYEIEREVADLDSERRRAIRQEKGRPIADALQAWLTAQRQKVPPGSATAKAIDYSLRRAAEDSAYSSTDGGKSARQMLEHACPDQYLASVDSCVAGGDEKNSGVVKAAVSAQGILRLMGK